ncbi:MAG: isocitrate/isopropylmalate dehydrogenase family protein [Candidatus Odinarchaeota archaeon]
MRTYKVMVIPGDGIGPSIVESAVEVLKNTNLRFEFSFYEAGDAAAEKYGSAMPKETLNAAAESELILKGPSGETAKEVVLPLRQGLGLFVNLRPARSLPGVKSRLYEGEEVNLLIVRENSEGLYSRIETLQEDFAFNTRLITRKATERIMRIACEQASRRRGKLTIVDKSNVLISDVFFRNICRNIGKNYPGIEINEMYVDNCAYQLVKNPSQFDVILTENMFGDILSDLASWVQGGLGLCPGANLSEDKGMFEPVHGAAFSMKNKNYANPTAMILSAKMMLDWIGLKHGDREASVSAEKIEKALIKTLAQGKKTPDIGGTLSTKEFTVEIIKNMEQT